MRRHGRRCFFFFNTTLPPPLLTCCAHCPSSSPSSSTVVLRSSVFNNNDNYYYYDYVNVLSSSPAGSELPATNGGAAAPALQQQVAGADALVSSGGIGMSSPAGSPSSPMVLSSSLGLRTPSPVAGNTIAGQVCTERTPGGVPASPSRPCAAGGGSGGGSTLTIAAAQWPRGCRCSLDVMLCASVTTSAGASPSPTPWRCGTSSRDLHAKVHGPPVAKLSVIFGNAHTAKLMATPSLVVPEVWVRSRTRLLLLPAVPTSGFGGRGRRDSVWWLSASVHRPRDALANDRGFSR